MVIEREDLVDHELYRTNGLRTQNKNTLIPILEVEMKKRTSVEWLKLLDAAGLPNSPLNTIDKVVTDPNLLHRNMIVEVDQPRIGSVTMAGSPFHLSETPGEVYSPAPGLGQHTAEVLSELLGYGDAEIQGFYRDGIVKTVD